MKLHSVIAAGTVATALALSGTPALAQGQSFISSTSHPLALPWVAAIPNFFIPEVNSRLEAAGLDPIDWNQQFPLPGLPPTGVLETLEEGTNQLSWVGTLFEPQKMGLLNVAFNAPFVTDNTLDQLAVFNGLYDQFPEMGQVWEDNGTVFLGAQATASYELITNFPVTDISDLDGRNIMSPGPQSQWIRNTGAVIADGSLPQAFNLLQTGVVDGVILPVTNAFAFKLYEVGEFLTLVNIGAQTTGGLAMSLDAFNSLTPEAQAIVRAVGREFSGVHGAEVTRRQQNALANWESEGGQVSVMSDEAKLAWLAALPSLGTEWVERNAAAGPSAEILAAYLRGMATRGHVPLRDWAQ